MAAVVVLALPGCGGESTEASDSQPEVTVFVAARSTGMEAIVGGRLEVVNGCLAADGLIIVMPLGTTVVSQNPLEVLVPNRGSFRLGDEVAFTGGAASPTVDEGGQPMAYGTPLREDCVGSRVLLSN